MAKTHDLRIEQGASFTERYAWSIDGERQQLTGWVPLSQIRTGIGGRVLLDLSPFFSIEEGITLGGTTGQAFPLHIPPSATRQLTRGGAWDLVVMTEDEHYAARLLEGKVDLIKGVSQ